MKYSIRFILSVAVLVGACVLAPSPSRAGVDLPWSSTYNCSEWGQGGPLSCDGLQKNGDWSCSGSGAEAFEQITGIANNPAGGGGAGQRHWIGDGLNNVSGGTRVTFNKPQSEVWVRWYMRFQPGFQWSSYEGFKVLYFFQTGQGSGPFYYTIAYGEDKLAMYTQTGDQQHYACTNCGWKTLYPTGRADGLWHAYEIHAKIESPGKADGVFEAWLDGTKVIDAKNVDYGMASKGSLFSFFDIGENTKYPNNGSCAYVDFDDVAVSNTGYIGPLGAQGTVPSAPTNLR